MFYCPARRRFKKFSPTNISTRENHYVLACTRLSKEKDPGFLLEIAREISNRNLPLHLKIIGTGPLERELRAHSDRSSLPVTFYSFLENKSEIRALMSEAEIFLAVGPIETFGLAAMESLACGTPVICRDSSAIRELINSQSGKAIERNVETWVDHIEKLLAVDRSNRRFWARERAEHFSWERTATTLIQTYTAELRPR